MNYSRTLIDRLELKNFKTDESRNFRFFLKNQKTKTKSFEFQYLQVKEPKKQSNITTIPESEENLVGTFLHKNKSHSITQPLRSTTYDLTTQFEITDL